MITTLKNYLFFLCSFFFLEGCTTTRAYENELESWLGRPESELIQTWGKPEQSEVLSDGGKKFTYLREHPSVKFVKNTETNRAKRLYDCKTLIVISPKGSVAGFKFEGPNCRQ